MAHQRRRDRSVNEGDIGMAEARPSYRNNHPAGGRCRVIHVAEREWYAVTQGLPCLHAVTS
jgi:hypothetical protein